MSQGRKGRMNYRCPNCFAKEVDADMLYDKDKDEYYCLRCYFVGTETEVLESYERTKKKYKLYKQRLNLLDELYKTKT